MRRFYGTASTQAQPSAHCPDPALMVQEAPSPRAKVQAHPGVGGFTLPGECFNEWGTGALSFPRCTIQGVVLF